MNARLTVNAGLRYELPMPFFETKNHYADAILEAGPLYGTILDAGQAAAHGYRRSLVDPNYRNLARGLVLPTRPTPRR